MRHPLLLAFLAACAASPSARVPDLPTLDVGYEPEAALVVPRRTQATPGARQALVSLRWVTGTPGATPLDSVACMVLADEGAPFRAASPVLSGWFLLQQPPATAPDSPPTPTREQETLLAADLTTRIRFGDEDLPELLLRLDGERLTVGLRAAGPDRQLVIVRDLEPDAGSRLTLLAAPAGAPRGLAITVSLAEPAAAEALATAHEQANAASGADPTEAKEPPWSAHLAREAVGAEPRRRALLGLVHRLHLDRCTDLVLSADERVLIAIARGLPEDAAEAYAIEQAVWRAVLPVLHREEATPALAASVRRHLGVLAMDATALEFVLNLAASRSEFEAAIEERNREALDARHADLRCAAVDWLRSSGHALLGYDPFAERDDRRAALRALEEEKR